MAALARSARGQTNQVARHHTSVTRRTVELHIFCVAEVRQAFLLSALPGVGPIVRRLPTCVEEPAAGCLARLLRHLGSGNGQVAELLVELARSVDSDGNTSASSPPQPRLCGPNCGPKCCEYWERRRENGRGRRLSDSAAFCPDSTGYERLRRGSCPSEWWQASPQINAISLKARLSAFQNCFAAVA